jgi:hypothetical protein
MKANHADEGWLKKDPMVDFLMAVDSGMNAKGREKRMEKVLALPQVRALVYDVSTDPWPPINSHRSAHHPLHKLSFLAELGASGEELGVEEALDRIIASVGEEGVPRLPMVITPQHGGTGKEALAWALCDAPTLVYSAIKLGRGDDADIRSATRQLTSLASPNGYRCVTSSSLGGFRGPGRKEDPCPYATLLMLKLLSLVFPASEEAGRARECLLDLWEHSLTRHPYIFHMGTDFRKLKYPLVWYDIMHVAEVLTRSDRSRDDPRLQDMVKVIAAQGDEDGRYTPGSVWLPWKEWDFGQKKAPSRILTYAVHRILSRYDSLDISDGV